MKEWFKEHFIPREKNGFRPRFLNRQNTKQLLGVVLFFELVLFILPSLNFTTYVDNLNLGSVLPSMLSSLTNAERLSQSLPELKESALLNQAAQLKAEDMASKGYFAHNSPEGKTPWYWLERVGYSYMYAGENLAVNFVDSVDVTEAWMNSPSHRANIIHGVYTEVGTGVAVGNYEGYETIFVAQLYGHPRRVNTSIAALVETNPVPPRPVSQSLAVNVPASTPAAQPEPEAPEEVLAQTQTQYTPAAKTPGINRVTQETIREFFQQAAASPRHTTNAVLYSVMTIVTLALLFNIFIKIKHQHPDLILNGAVVMVVLLGLNVANLYISKEEALRTSFVAYDSSNEILNQE
jgi:hypothetical protein